MAFRQNSLMPVKMKLDNAFEKVDTKRYGTVLLDLYVIAVLF